MNTVTNNFQEWRVFHFTFTSGGIRRRMAVAAPDIEEAKALLSAMFDKVTSLRERAAG
jgi:hypothetical protein